MATQHPDNAHAPYWEKDGDGFVNVQEEIAECVSCFRDLGTEEYMWDWEGKFADEAVIDKLFSQYHEYFKRHLLGKEKFLTFRIPNIWQEKGYGLLRALMVILTSEDFARDIHFHAPPLFEVILPMTECASQLLYIQKSFRALAHFKKKTFNHTPRSNTDMIEMIPLLEGVQNQLHAHQLIEQYVKIYKKTFHQTPTYIRPFLARSDPAMISGLIATVLANKVALSDIAMFSQKTGIKTHPIIGVGSLVFRGGLTPHTVNTFLAQYGGARTVTVQSGFRYDFPLRDVQHGIRTLNARLPKTKTELTTQKERHALVELIARFERAYQSILPSLLPTLKPLFAAVPQRRERRQHTGLLSYPRRMGTIILPRAIGFTGSFYTIGVPPEFIGIGRVLASLTAHEWALLNRYYKTMREELVRAGRFLNQENLDLLARGHNGWRDVRDDIKQTEKFLRVHFGPKTKQELLHEKLSTQLLRSRHNPRRVEHLFTATGKLRHSLG